MKRVVLALGGNALGNTPKEQLDRVKITADAIVKIVKQGYEVIVCHGNGPQVGMINLAFDNQSKAGKSPYMDLPECTAMSQGYIGYHLQQAIDQALSKENISTPVVTMVTQIVVDKNDPAFSNPTKPIGSFYTEEEAKKLMQESNDIYKEDAGRGWRKVVASPKPISIHEKETLNTLINSNHVVIAGGGGGIPIVYENDNSYHGISAVIDKDLAAAKIAELVNADLFVIMTAVDYVAINFGKPNQVNLDEITLEEAEKFINEGQFAAGSMLPKVKATIEFIKSNKNDGKAIICSLEKALEALEGKIGTKIVKSK